MVTRKLARPHQPGVAVTPPATTSPEAGRWSLAGVKVAFTEALAATAVREVRVYGLKRYARPVDGDDQDIIVRAQYRV